MAIEALPRHDVLLLLELTEDPSIQGLETYLSRTLELCADWFEASGASLFLRDREEGAYSLAASAGVDTKVPKDAVIRHGEGIAGSAIANGEPMLLHERIEHVLQGKSSSIGSSMIVPLRTRQFGKLGVLCLSRRKGEPKFSENDLNVARSFAGQIALAVANARLFAETLSFQKELDEAKRLAEIGQMTAAIAHEIRNPLTGIRAAAQMVLDSDTAELGEIIIEETDKLDRLCGEFLDFARPLKLEREEVFLGEIVARVGEMERDQFERTNVLLLLEIEAREPKIYVDPRRMEQVCRNLIRNGLQACRDGGTVVVRVGKSGLEVKDTGAGMSVEELSKLFTPFFTTKPQGTGLGMSVVKKIVDAHGGRITVVSQKGEGTSIRIELRQDKKQV